VSASGDQARAKKIFFVKIFLKLFLCFFACLRIFALFGAHLCHVLVSGNRQDDKFKFARPALSSQVSRHLRLDVGNLRSPQPFTGNGTATATSAGLSKTSPNKEASPFRCPTTTSNADLFPGTVQLKFRSFKIKAD
jgi:hypothetical protein